LFGSSKATSISVTSPVPKFLRDVHEMPSSVERHKTPSTPENTVEKQVGSQTNGQENPKSRKHLAACQKGNL
jgi:hypothetical protein